MTGGDLLLLGLIAYGLWWLARDAKRERKWVNYARNGQAEVERFLQAEAEGWR